MWGRPSLEMEFSVNRKLQVGKWFVTEKAHLHFVLHAWHIESELTEVMLQYYQHALALQII